MTEATLRLSALPQSLAVCRLDPGAPLPAWVGWQDPLVSVTRTAEELSIVCPAVRVPGDVRAERGWRAFKVEGPLDFALTGILARLSTCLADAGISLFAVSTFDTDFLLVREAQFDAASAVLARDFELAPGA